MSELIVDRLYNNFDELIELDDKLLSGERLGRFEDDQVVNETFSLIHQYVALDQQSKPYKDENMPITVAESIQGWLVRGENPLQHLGKVSASILVAKSTEVKIPELEERDRKKLLESKNTDTQDYASTSKLSFTELSEESIQDNQVPNGFFDFPAMETTTQKQHKTSRFSPKYIFKKFMNKKIVSLNILLD